MGHTFAEHLVRSVQLQFQELFIPLFLLLLLLTGFLVDFGVFIV